VTRVVGISSFFELFVTHVFESRTIASNRQDYI
jgi:hypothetical protein